MRPGMVVRLDRNWGRYAELINHVRYGARLRQNIRKAMVANAHLIKMEVRDNVRKGHHSKGRKPNAALTIAIKGRDQPLVDGGALARAVRSKVKGWDTAEVDIYDPKIAWLAELLHNGYEIPVTEPMRRMFNALYQASIGDRDPSTLVGRAAELWARNQEWYPIGSATTRIKIPARPFFSDVIESRAVREAVARNNIEAVSHAIAGLPFVASPFLNRIKLGLL